MRKKNIYTLFSLAVLIALSIWAYNIANTDNVFSGKKTTIDEAETDFVIEDTASVTKLVISDQDKNKVVVEEARPGLWRLGTGHQARVDAVNLILETAKRIHVREKVSDAGKPNIIRNMSVDFHKVEFYAGEKWLKSWYVGHPTKDNDGSFMILETPENGKAENPYITHIPGFSGELSSRFFTALIDWRDHGIFRHLPEDIQSVSVTNYDTPAESFTVEVKGENLFSLSDGNKKNVSSFDTVAVRAFLLGFKNINYLTLNHGHLSPGQEDSIKKAKPFFRVSLATKSGALNEILIFHKKVQDGQLDLEGKPYPWDTELAFAQLRTGEIAIIQFGHFAKILWPLQRFRTH